jgi:hypothetical protein
MHAAVGARSATFARPILHWGAIGGRRGIPVGASLRARLSLARLGECT